MTHPQDDTAPGYDPRVALLQCALAWEAGARLVGNVTATNVAKVAALTMTQCPACGSEAWVNIDCEVCAVVGRLVSDVSELRAARTPVEAGVVTREEWEAAWNASDGGRLHRNDNSHEARECRSGFREGYIAGRGAARTPPAELTAEVLADFETVRKALPVSGKRWAPSRDALDRIEAHIKGKTASPPQEPPARAVVELHTHICGVPRCQGVSSNGRQCVFGAEHSGYHAHNPDTWLSDPQEGERES